MKQLNFSKIGKILEIPDLLSMQSKSFEDFLQLDKKPEERELQGLQAAFLDIFPIESTDGSYVLDFIRYEIGDELSTLIRQEDKFSAKMRFIRRFSCFSDAVYPALKRLHRQKT